ncbi:MAG TPA: hypothetical protein VJ784_05670 [Pyrinomonadaceae bacterium]|nr:hypothetical protein [Pyrinomonadaceae bacterium]
MTSSFASLLIVIALWLSMAIFCCAGSDNKPLSVGERAEALRGKEKGCETVERLKTAGGFTKIEPGYSGVTHAYVGREFYAIDVDAKETALKAVALCHVDLEKRGQLGLVIVHDGFSGKRIGSYDFASGFKIS